MRDQGCDGAGWRQRLSRSAAWKVGKGLPPKDGSVSRCPSVRDQLRGEDGGAARGQHGNRCGAEGGGRSTDPLPDIAHEDPVSDPHVVAQRWAVASSLDLGPSAHATPAPAHPPGQQVPAWKDEAAAEPWAPKSEDQTQALNRKGDAPPTPADGPCTLASVSSSVDLLMSSRGHQHSWTELRPPVCVEAGSSPALGALPMKPQPPLPPRGGSNLGWQSVLSLQKPLSVTLHPAPHCDPLCGPKSRTPTWAPAVLTQGPPTQKPCGQAACPGPNWPWVLQNNGLAPESRHCHLRSKGNPALSR